MVNISYHTNGYLVCSLEEAIDHIADYGYDGVEIHADEPHIYLPKSSREDWQKLRQKIESVGLEAPVISAVTMSGYYGPIKVAEFLMGPGFVNPEKHLREARISYTKLAIDFAAELNAKCVLTTSGKELCVGFQPPEIAWPWLIEGLSECVDYAQGRGIRVAIENEPETSCATTQDILRAVEEINSPWLGVGLDIGHCIVFGEDLVDSIRKTAHKNRLFHIHVEDIKDQKHYHRIPGDGDIDFKVFLNVVKEVSYDGFLTVELYTYGNGPLERSNKAAKESMVYMRRLLRGE